MYCSFNGTHLYNLTIKLRVKFAFTGYYEQRRTLTFAHAINNDLIVINISQIHVLYIMGHFFLDLDQIFIICIVPTLPENSEI